MIRSLAKVICDAAPIMSGEFKKNHKWKLEGEVEDLERFSVVWTEYMQYRVALGDLNLRRLKALSGIQEKGTSILLHGV